MSRRKRARDRDDRSGGNKDDAHNTSGSHGNVNNPSSASNGNNNSDGDDSNGSGPVPDTGGAPRRPIRSLRQHANDLLTSDYGFAPADAKSFLEVACDVAARMLAATRTDRPKGTGGTGHGPADPKSGRAQPPAAPTVMGGRAPINDPIIALRRAVDMIDGGAGARSQTPPDPVPYDPWRKPPNRPPTPKDILDALEADERDAAAGDELDDELDDERRHRGRSSDATARWFRQPARRVPGVPPPEPLDIPLAWVVIAIEQALRLRPSPSGRPRRRRKLSTAPKRVESLLKAARPHFLLFSAMAKASRHSGREIEEDYGAYRHVRHHCDEFAAALSPRQLRFAMALPGFWRWPATFAARAGWTQEDLRRHLRDLAVDDGLAPEAAARLADRVPHAAIRLTPDDQMRVWCDHFRNWEPLVEFIVDTAGAAAGRDGPGGRPTRLSAEKNRLSNKLRVMLRALARHVRDSLYGGGGGSAADAMDAVNNAVLDLIRAKPGEPGFYYYQVDAFRFLVAAAAKSLLASLRRRQAERMAGVARSEEWLGPTSTALESLLNRPGVELRQIANLLFILQGFKPGPSKQRVLLIWMLDQVVGRRMTNREMAFLISIWAGELHSADDVAQSRHAMRQRLAAVEIASRSDPREPPEYSAPTGMESDRLDVGQWDVTTWVCLWLVRASKNEGDEALAWATFYGMIVHWNVPVAQAELYLQWLSALLQGNGGPIPGELNPGQLRARAAKAARWVLLRAVDLAEIRGFCQRYHLTMFLPAAVYLILGQGLTAEQTILILSPHDRRDRMLTLLLTALERPGTELPR